MLARGFKQRIHTPVVLVSAVAVLSVFALDVRHGDVIWPPALEITLWLALAGLAVASPIPLPGRRAEASLVPVVEFAAVIALDPVVACGLASFWHLVSAAGSPWRTQSLRSIGGAILPVGCAGLMARAVSGWDGLPPHSVVLVPWVASALTYILVREGLAIWEDVARKPRWAGSSVRESADRTIWDTLLMPCAVLLATVHQRSGIAATSLLFIPLILARHFGRIWSHAKAAQLETVRTLMAAIDASDPFTRGHSHRVSKMCVAIGRRMGLSPEEIEELEYAALLHDIGRTAIRREIVFKAGKLASEETSILRTHPRIGRDIIDRIRSMPRAAEAVYRHHEQPDGQGYPEGLAGNAIPVSSRIIMVAAAFDAMTSDRPYRRGMHVQAALEELLAHGGTQFFPDVVQALIELYADGRLFDGFEAEVLEQHARGEGGSRAVEEHVRRRGSTIRKAGVGGDPLDAHGAIDAPMLEPGGGATNDVVERVILLSESGLKLAVAGLSDVGCVRNENEDAWGIFPAKDGGACLLAVADGVGGEAAGEIASRLAVETVRGAFFGAESGRDVSAVLRESVCLANEFIHARGVEEPHLQGMGTTCVAAAVVGSRLTVAHVGDSRAYVVDGRRIDQLTRDHNLAEELMSAVGRRGPAGAQHVLTRSLGGRTDVEVDVSQPLALKARDVVILCSDGLFGVVSEEEIREVVLASSPGVACRRLVDRAIGRGGPDNVTVVVARVEVAS